MGTGRTPGRTVALVEGPDALPGGRALDLGCGIDSDTIYLTEHGWDVTGVDLMPQALAIARRKAAAAGVGPRFLEGDVTRLADLGVGDGYSLLVDFPRERTRRWRVRSRAARRCPAHFFSAVSSMYSHPITPSTRYSCASSMSWASRAPDSMALSPMLAKASIVGP
jgi:SAM-dependent methyltransferase